MTAGRFRRGSEAPDTVADEGPFVSFTDLFIGVLFLFLILVAALMLMHQQAMAEARAEVLRLEEEMRLMQAELDELRKLDIDHPPYRLAIVFNSYQRPAGPGPDWKFSRTVQLFRTADGLCVENVILRNNLNLGWKPPIEPGDIPTPDRADLRQGRPCTLTALGEQWDMETETGGVERVAPDLYAGSTVLHSDKGEQTVEIEYRILGVYDDYYRYSGPSRRPARGPVQEEPPAGRSFGLQ